MQYLFTVVKYCKLTCCLQYCITFVDSCAMQFIKSKVPICFGYLAGCSFKRIVSLVRWVKDKCPTLVRTWLNYSLVLNSAANCTEAFCSGCNPPPPSPHQRDRMSLPPLSLVQFRQPDVCYWPQFACHSLIGFQIAPALLLVAATRGGGGGGKPRSQLGKK